ncbi:MAG TPA: ATP-binding protein [Anaerolineaceae bacterium]
MPTSSTIEPKPSRVGYPGDPNCPICGGVGYIRQELPIHHPDFGKLVMCTCLQKIASKNAQNRLFRLSNLESFQEMTFDMFKTRGRLGLGDDQVKSLANALSLAEQYAANLQGWLLLMGSYGSGKTHLAAAVAGFAVSHGVETLFLTVPDLLDWLRYSYDSPDATFEQRFDEIRNVRLLVLDDLGTQNATPWAEEKLFQVINHRYVNKLSTVVTTNLDMAEIDGRISSRLQDADLVSLVRISAPDYRMPNKEMGQSRRTDLPLLDHCTFGNFSLREFEKLEPDVRQNLEKVFREARQYAEEPSGWLVISGGYFSGKTHLAAAIGNYRLSGGYTVSFWVVAELLDHLRATFSPSSNITYDHLFEEVKTSPLLILDDLGGQSTTPWAQEKLYQILSFRYNASLPTVITTLKTLDEIEPRLRSRMMDRRRCNFLALLAPAYTFATAGKGENRTRGRKTARENRLILYSITAPLGEDRWLTFTAGRSACWKTSSCG